MTEAVRARLYLTLEVRHMEYLEELLRTVEPACVRLLVGEGDVAAAKECRSLCHALGVPLLTTGPDDVAVSMAREAGADGVHLVGSPKAAPWAKRELGETCIVGIDPGESRHDAMIAAEAGADYVALSPRWDDEDTVPEAIAWWSAIMETPLVAETARTPRRAHLVRDMAEFVAAGPDEAEAISAALT